MAKGLLAVAILVILTISACSNPAPTATSQAETQPSATQTADPAKEPTTVARAQPTQVPTKAPDPTATSTPEPTAAATSTPEPTAAATSTSEPTAARAPTPAPLATAQPITTPPAQPASLWRGITVAPENRCSPYDSDDYRYAPSVEPKIVDAQGGIYGPYTGTWFNRVKDTDIEHIVARSEAHDSGLCAASPTTRDEFASDLLNLTLASPSVNRHQKVANDVSEWLPDLNKCWYVNRTIEVRREYGLTIDRAEANAADQVLAGCESTEMVMLPPGTSTNPSTTATPTPAPDVDALALYDDNGNGRITCAEARAHSIAPVHRGHPAYEYMRDADGDGVVCE